MYSDDYRSEDDDCDDGRQQLEEYELHCHEIKCKANALLNIPAAEVLARKFAEDLANLVHTHADFNGLFALSDVLKDSVPEKVIANTFRHCRNYLHIPLSHAGFIAARKTLDAVCIEFEKLLAAETTLPAAREIARKVAGNLAALVRKHVGGPGDTTLAYILRDSVAEHVLTEALQVRASVLEQPVTREGCMAIRKVLTGACRAFEDLLRAHRQTI